MITHNISLDMRKRPGVVPPRITLRRGESQTQKIMATITDDGTAYSSTYTSARLCILHADGTWARVTATRSENTVYATLDSAAINGTGRCRLAYFEFYSSNGYYETTQNFELVILGNVDGTTDQSKSYSDEIDALIKLLEEEEAKLESAEAKRATAESARVSAESNRVTAENARETACDTAVDNANKAADTAYAAAKAVETATLGLSPVQISAMVKLGTASTVLPVGTQLFTPLNDNAGNVAVEKFAWDVVHHFDGSDEDHPLVTLENGKQVKGLMLMAHRALPWSIVWEPKQAAIAVTGDMPAGTYHFAVKVTIKWASGIAAEAGEKTYQFTTTQALTEGAQLVYSGDDKTDPTTATLIAYASATSTTELGRYALSLGSDGTDLGIMTDATSSTNAQTYAELNNIQRMIYGSNRWATSQERAVLNANGTVTQGGTLFARPWNMAGQNGVLARLPEDFVSVLGKVARTQELHHWDGTGHDSADNYLETVYDYLFPISAREHAFSNYLSATADGFKAEGVPLDYWTALRTASGRTTWAGWNTYPELITYDSVATTTARAVWLLSAYRGAYFARSVGHVSTSGGVGSASAYASYYAVPACVII